MRGSDNVFNNKAEYLIILGCHVTSENTSHLLSQRGLTAVSYLNRNPDTKAIVSGGKSPGENITEAEVLKKLLLDNNIGSKRIFSEDQSKNTLENLKFSDELYDLRDKNLMIVTSDYHIFRALSIAKKLEFTNVSALPSRTPRIILPALHIREYVSIVHNILFGRI